MHDNLLKTLTKYIAQLEKKILSMPTSSFSYPRFDSKLFHSQYYEINDYLHEVNINFTKFKDAIKSNKLSQANFLSDLIINQVNALCKEVATQALRQHDHKVFAVSKEDFYQKFATYQEYERRLRFLIQDRLLTIENTVELSLKQKLQKEIVTLEQRLLRCQAAIKKLELKIERSHSKIGK